MDHLEQFEERSKINLRGQVQVLRQLQNGSSAYLTQRINFLKRKKLELARKLDMLDKEIQEKDWRSHENEQGEEARQTAKFKLGELKDISLAHRLTGISVYSVEKGKIIICFDNSWHNQFCNSDYLELVQKTDGNLALGRYTLPCFIPVAQLAEKHLLDDPQKFVSSVSDYLFAHAMRREEIKVVKILFEESEDWLKIDVTESVDYIKIVVGTSHDSINLKIELIYDDLLQILPSKVQFAIKENDDTDFQIEEKMIDKWQEQLELLPLSKVLPDIIQSLLSSGLISDKGSSQDSSTE